ncbi:MAG: hypothetical protein M1835_006597 [Candelina submexicana]|nr:MAG: hypothetical protein M1835_006597 [Candelina submexicana]
MLKRLRSRATSWVMLSTDGQGFIPLTQERILYTSPPRTTLVLQTPNTYPGKTFSVNSNAGCVYLTNQRIVYVPASPTASLQSFQAPILNLHDSHVSAPFFGPNVWTAVLQPVPGGGIPPTHAVVEIKMTFKEGGAFDFHSNFERIKERLQQAVETARENGHMDGDGTDRGTGGGHDPLAGISMAAVHLDELPAYEEAAGAPSVPAAISTSPMSPTLPSAPTMRDSGIVVSSDDERNAKPSEERLHSETVRPPTGPPPGYEEVQRDSVAHELEQRLRRA